MSPRFRVLLPVLLLALVALVGTRRSAALQGAAPRVALVIGNAAYASRPLKNPVNDARAMAAVLKQLGFAATLLEDADKRRMLTAVQTFGAALPTGGAALVYYSGHGAQLKDRNYLIPVGADIGKEADLEFEAVDAGRILAELERPGERVGILILDACRDNPFGAQVKSSARGLLPLQAPAGTVVAYAAAPGQVADDNPNGANGLYTEELLKHLQTPGLKVEDVFKRTREGVLRRSGNKQFPKEDFALVRDFVFQAGNAPLAVKPERKASVALVEVTSAPAGARIYLDGQDTGQVTPATLEVDLGTALRRSASLEARQGGKAGKPEKVVLQAGRQTDVVLTLDLDLDGGAGRQAGETRVNAKDGAVMVWVPAGEFDMGSNDGSTDEQPMHRVRLTQGYWLYQTEVTHAMYSRFVRETGHRQPAYQENARYNGAQQPVVGVSWDDAVVYARWAGGRLPTEAEWEYAARGMDGRKYPWGNQEPNESLAVFNLPLGTGSTAAVGSKRAGASWCGALDLAGNVWERCSDYYDGNYYQMGPRQDPENTINSQLRVLRGGSWLNRPDILRTAGRSRGTPDARNLLIGFRLVRTP